MPTTYPCVELAQKFILQDGQDAINVFNIEYTAALTLADATTFADLLHQAWVDNLKAYTNDQITYDSVTVTDLRTVGAPQYVITYADPGTSGTDALPQFVAALVSWTTALRTRSTRGRTYLTGFVEGSSEGNILSSGIIGHIQDWIGQMQTSFGSLGVLSRKNGTMEPIVAGAVNPFWKRMSRREHGH